MTNVSDPVDQEVRIRRARRAELDELAEVDTDIFADLAYPYFVLRQLFDLHLGWWLVVAHPDGLRGYSLGVPTHDRRGGWLLGLGVREQFRRRGYGRSLTRTSMRMLAGVGVERVRLTVDPGNQSALGLYRGLGFVVEEVGKDYFGPGVDRLIMVADLRGRPAV